ncbi:MAG: SH3 domain-containing protein [Armatimonadetes bacterium]|nr:SH3 domain-containing protein [Armatimonadota bacterium]
MRPLTTLIAAIVGVLWQAFPASAYEIAVVQKPAQITLEGRRPRTFRPAAERVEAGERVLVLFRDGDRAAVVLGSAQVVSPTMALLRFGYVPKTCLRALGREASSAATVEDPDGYVNLRAGPSKDYPVLARVPRREAVFVLGPGEWTRVMTAAGREGYLHSSRLRFTSLDGGSVAVQRSLLETVRKERSRKGPSNGAKFDIFRIGTDLYIYTTDGRLVEHARCLPRGGAVGNWALVDANSLTAERDPIFFPAASPVLERRGEAWEIVTYLEETLDRKVAARMPENVKRALGLDSEP